MRSQWLFSTGNRFPACLRIGGLSQSGRTFGTQYGAPSSIGSISWRILTILTLQSCLWFGFVVQFLTSERSLADGPKSQQPEATVFPTRRFNWNPMYTERILRNQTSLPPCHQHLAHLWGFLSRFASFNKLVKNSLSESSIPLLGWEVYLTKPYCEIIQIY